MNPNLCAAERGVCPTAAAWAEALRGQADDATWERMEAHFRHCPDCERTVDALTERSDTYVRLLCSGPPTLDDEPAFQRMHDELVSGGSQPAWGATADSGAAPRQWPDRMGPYELLMPLGHGTSGSVFRARHIPLDRIVAIKLWRDGLLSNDAAADRFVREVRAVAKLDHPHIVRATDAGQWEGQHFLAMEYVPGTDLSTVLAACHPLRVADACEVVRQAALGLDYLHRHGFVHRDVKPSNLLLTGAGQIKLLDLGLVQSICRVRSEGEAQIAAGPSAARWPHGTADYMAPEQWRDQQPLDGRADIYSLGCTWFKLLTGQPPFRPLPAGFHDRYRAHCEAPIPRLADRREGLPDGLQRILDRMLAKTTDRRYGSAAELIRDLTGFARRAELAALARRAGLAPTADMPWHPLAEGQRRCLPGRISRRQVLAATAVGVGAMLTMTRVAGRRPTAPSIGTQSWRSLRPQHPTLLLSDSDTGPPSDRAWEETQPGVFQLRPEGQRLVLNLGQPLQGCFRIAMTMSFESAAARCGWFLGLQRTDDPAVVSYRGQLLEVVSGGQTDSMYEGLVWSGCYVSRLAGGWRWQTEPWGELTMGEGPSPQPANFQLELGTFPLPRVTWRERSQPASRWQLSHSGRQRIGQSGDRLQKQLLGHLGVVAQQGVATFASPRLAYLGRHQTAG